MDDGGLEASAVVLLLDACKWLIQSASDRILGDFTKVATSKTASMKRVRREGLKAEEKNASTLGATSSTEAAEDSMFLE